MAKNTVRERLEELERETLSPHAALSSASRGRARPEEPCPVRTCFQRDRDRIIHYCKAFRRLAHKTQVFLSPQQDHIRTRLTHTLEVSQIARTIAKALRLNEDLTEAIALGHDVGHTPFGHAGEIALDRVYRRYDPEAHFNHYEQSERVVTVLERDGQGLNLCWETVDGIRHHSKGELDFAPIMDGAEPATLEGKVVRVADRIAYVNHDIDDALRAGMIDVDDLPQSALAVLGRTHSQRIGTVVEALVAASSDKPYLVLAEPVVGAMNDLKDYLFEKAYARCSTSPEQLRRIQAVIGGLFDYYLHQRRDEFGGDDQEAARKICDHLAGMTDRYSMQTYQQIFLPEAFGGEHLGPP